MNHCLKTGGKHVEPDHFRLMLNCAEMPELSGSCCGKDGLTWCAAYSFRFAPGRTGLEGRVSESKT